jgi:hypothetical protein
VQVALGGRQICVAHDVLDRHRIDDADQQTSRGVSEVVEPKARKTRRIATSDVASPERGGIGPLAGDSREYIVVRPREVRSPAETLERCEGLVGNGYVSDPAALSRSLVGARKRATHDENPLDPRHVVPSKGDKFAPSKSRVRGYAEKIREFAILLAAQMLGVHRDVGPPATPYTALGGSRQCLNLLDREDLEMAGVVLRRLRVSATGFCSTPQRLR